MRLHALLLVTGAALCVRAASIPVAEIEKKIIEVVPDNIDKLPENTSSEQELIDQANTIKDVNNKLRTKPEDIPVKVFDENAFSPLSDVDVEEEINRPAPDLRNPGPPQRQEHETQNPEYYASEQQKVTLFKQSINEAQNVLRQGFQGITDGIQNIIETNEPILTLQQNIQSLRDSFTAQIVKVNGTIQSFLNTESASIGEPVVEQTKAGFLQIEQGLFKLRNDFNRGVSTLAGGVEVVAALKADSETPNDSSSPSPASPTPSPVPASPFLQIVQNMATQFQESLKNMTETINKYTQGQSWNPFNQPSGTTATPSVPSGAQSDSQVTSAPSNNFFQQIQNQFNGGFNKPAGQGWDFVNNLFSIFQPKPAGQAPQGTPGQPPAQTPSKPEEAKPETNRDKPAAVAETPAPAATVTPAGPIRQILQNNPITQGIAGAVQRIQNLNNPEKPRDEQTAAQTKKSSEDKTEPESKKGGGSNNGSNNGEYEHRHRLIYHLTLSL